MPKKKWEKPKLIVLVRGKPEERLLDACKRGGGSGPGGLASSCSTIEMYVEGCIACDASGVS